MISVCMATYNGEKYIKEQLDSILKQIGENDEIIISDDGSTDLTISILKQYASEYANIMIKKGPRQGVIKNFENALMHSKGDYIFLSDQDDIWVDGKVSKIMEQFNKKKASVVLHDAVIVDGNGTEIGDSFFKHRGSKPGFINNMVKNSYLGCCMAFDRNILNIALPFPESIEMHDWWIGLLGELYGDVIFLDDRLLRYRRHGNNVSSFHHHPLRKMIFNRVYLVSQVIKRMRRRSKE